MNPMTIYIIGCGLIVLTLAFWYWIMMITDMGFDDCYKAYGGRIAYERQQKAHLKDIANNREKYK